MSDVLRKAIEAVGNKFEDLSSYFGNLEMEKVITLNGFEETLPISINDGYWQVNSPVAVVESKLIERLNIKTNENSRYVTVTYRNVSNQEVKAIRGIVTYLNAFDEEIESKMFELVDINAKPGELFGHRYHAKMNNSNVRNLKLTMIKIMFKNNQKWYVSEDTSVILSNHEIFKENIDTCDELTRFKFSLTWNQLNNQFDMINLPKVAETYWICPCGTLNHNANETCCLCHTELKKINGEMTIEKAEKAYLVYKDSMEKLEAFLTATNKKLENERIKKMITLNKPAKKSWLTKKSVISQ